MAGTTDGQRSTVLGISTEGANWDHESDPSGRRPSGRRLVAVQVGQFALAGAVALAIVAGATSVASRRVGEREAITEARTTTVIRAQGVVTPALTDALLDGDAEAIAAVEEVVQRDVLDDDLVRVKLWSPEGTVVYSDEPALIGTDWDLGADEQQALATGEIEAEVSDLTRPENTYEAPYGELLEVYLPVRTPSGQPLLFEAYYRYELVTENGSRLWSSFAPIALGALVMLEVVQIPLAWSLARRLRLRLREREGLLRRALEASEVERRQIASDLHDGVVQDLTGVAFALSAATRRAPDPAVDGPLLESAAESLRANIRALRSLLVDIYPPDFDQVSLPSALADLLARAADDGLVTTLAVDELRDPLPDHLARLVYRTVQEALRNVALHARASSVGVRVATEGRDAVVEIVDDGEGFDAAALAARQASGHLGLTALRGLVTDAGGTLVVTSTPGRGTTVRAQVPLP